MHNGSSFVSAQEELRTVKPGEVRSRELPKLQRRDSVPPQWPSTPLQAAASIADNAKPDAVSSSAVRAAVHGQRRHTMCLAHRSGRRCLWMQRDCRCWSDGICGDLATATCRGFASLAHERFF